MKKLLLALTIFIASDSHAGPCMAALDNCMKDFLGYCNSVKSDNPEDKEAVLIVQELCGLGAQRSCAMTVTKKFGPQVCGQEAYDVLKQQQAPPKDEPKEQHSIHDHGKYEARYER